MVIRSRERCNFCQEKTFVCRENVSLWTERRTDKIGNDILETLENVCTLVEVFYSLRLHTGYGYPIGIGLPYQTCRYGDPISRASIR
jgi:RNA-splicing ligase RtcB